MYRSNCEILAHILITTQEKRAKTRILHEANLDFRKLQEYLILRLSTNLLNSIENDGRTYYETTKKGFRFLEDYQEIQNLLRIKIPQIPI